MISDKGSKGRKTGKGEHEGGAAREGSGKKEEEIRNCYVEKRNKNVSAMRKGDDKYVEEERKGW